MASFGEIQISEAGAPASPVNSGPIPTGKGSRNGLAELLGHKVAASTRQASRRDGSLIHKCGRGLSYPQFIGVAISCAFNQRSIAK